MKIVIVALPGSGKTTILNFVKQKLPDVKIVNYGDVMLEIAKKRFGIQHRDEMRKKIPVDEYRKVQEEAAEYIASLTGDVIIDTHASIKIGGGYYPGLPDRIISKLKPDVILLLEYDPKVILERRKKDPDRFRDLESEEEIEMHQQANRYYAFAAANAGESTVHVLNFRGKPESRPFEHAEVAAEYIVNLILRTRQKS
ncbi:adenylate kinase [Pyrobaculum aerophilum]|uniref:Adenylate kinase n=2 Tax=Pyrobaculum aerophilum TaxID=13773 RepID=KADA_PYRAE|nr:MULTISPECIES: adenylate kinase [Pyrobaculum]Q8ZWP7.1 RecName: Full=Adenylate kinase; Short=AK; AltName: Full=ATP-AMP transphosphorylase [Pyrobaculum aerophilum str. IM2]AAL63653.1 adenylate kinase [Pyrobaculum aerophilum str. IM2]MCX8136447.1 adenylate kinase [Pyrobaculum aerophilum]HII46001.1 adenylate kinase [Pyrobaculum aerophilum]